MSRRVRLATMTIVFVVAITAVAIVIVSGQDDHKNRPLGSSQGGSIDVFAGSTPTPVSTPTPDPSVAQLWVAPSPGSGCARSGTQAAYNSATDCTLAAAITAASNSDLILFKTGSYGTWTGTTKTVTLRAESGQIPTMRVNFTLSATSGFTIDGFGGMGGDMTGSTTTARNITIKNSAFNATLTIDGPRDSNILLDHNTHNNINFTDTPARIHLSYGVNFHSGVTVQNSMFDGGSTDGIQAGAGINIIDNEFTNIREGSCGECHTDAIQLIGAPGSTVDGNWLHDNQDGITAFDGIDDATIINNAVGPDQSDPDCIDMYSMQDSLVEHNSCTTDLGIYLDHKPADPASSGNTIQNNVADLSGPDMGSGATKTKNLFSGASSPNINGNPTFIGGSSPTSYIAFRLAGGSAGKNGATDGSDVGIP